MKELCVRYLLFMCRLFLCLYFCVFRVFAVTVCFLFTLIHCCRRRRRPHTGTTVFYCDLTLLLLETKTVTFLLRRLTVERNGN